MLVVPGPGPARDVLKVALFQGRHRECIRILVILACLASFRRGRSAINFTFCKNEQRKSLSATAAVSSRRQSAPKLRSPVYITVTSPISFLLWCLGLIRRRDRHDRVPILHWNTSSDSNALLHRARGRRAGWRGALIGRNGRGCESEVVSEQQGGGVGSRTTRAAALGERGRQSAFEGFRRLRRDGVCCDVTLLVAGAHFVAHKCVVAAQSSPLRAMFEGSFKEGSEDVITLRDVEPSSFSLLLDFLYGLSVEITEDNVEALLDLSARYGVALLRRHCCAFMAGSAEPSKACCLLAMADRYDCRRLRRELLVYTLECFPLACCCDSGTSDGFLHLSTALVAEVLKDDRLVAGEEGEVKVFWAAVSWLEADQSRRRDADDVLSHVRFGLVSAKTLADAVEGHPLMQSEASRRFVHEAYRFQALPPESRDELASSMASRARPRAARARADGVLPSPLSAAAAGGDASGVHSRFSRIEPRSNPRESRTCASNDGGGAVGGSGGVCFEDGDALFSDSDEEREIDAGGEGGGNITDPERDEVGRRAEGDGGSGSGAGAAEDSGARTPRALSSAEKMTGEQAARGEAEGEGRGSETGDVSPRKSHAAEPSVGRKSWGAGLRMYV